MQAAAGRFVAEYEHVLQGVEANPTRSLPGFEPDTVNCVSLAAVRQALWPTKNMQQETITALGSRAQSCFPYGTCNTWQHQLSVHTHQL